MAKKRRSFSREFKVEAVKLVTEQRQSIAEAARSLGIGENQLRTWKQALANESQGEQQAFPGHGNRPALEAEIHRLRTENKRLLMERDILKTTSQKAARKEYYNDFPTQEIVLLAFFERALPMILRRWIASR
jgi:transposase